MNVFDLEMIQGKTCKGEGAWGQDDKNKQGQCQGKGGSPGSTPKASSAGTAGDCPIQVMGLYRLRPLSLKPEPGGHTRRW